MMTEQIDTPVIIGETEITGRGDDWVIIRKTEIAVGRSASPPATKLSPAEL